MSDAKDPVRWIEGDADAPEGFAELARERGPGAEQLARMIDGVAREVGRPELGEAYRAQAGAGAGAGVSAGAGAGAGASAGAGIVGKVGVAVAVIGLAAAGWWWLGGAASEAPAAGATRPPVSPVAAPAPPEPRQEPVAVEAPRPATPEVTAKQAQATAGEPRAPRPHRPARAAVDGLDPAAELALLEQAQLALRDDPARALSLAERHRTRFARGQFEQEREMLAIEALLRLSRKAEAARRGAAFERRHPRSGHLPRLRDLLQAAR